MSDSTLLTPAAAAAASAQALPTLEAHGVGFSYAGQTPVFADVSLSVKPGEIIALLGGSGCGKSTLLRGLAGLSQFDAGRVSFLGEPLARPHPRAALIFQHASLLPWRSVESNVRFGLDFKSQPRIDRSVRQQRVSDALQAVGLLDKAKRSPLALSGGQAQRVALARALVREPAMLFADEPFAALDAITRSHMQTLLVDLVHRWNTSALLVTHDIDEAIVVADRILLMGRQGREPARIVREWTVDIERPREGRAQDATALHFDILAALKELHD